MPSLTGLTVLAAHLVYQLDIGNWCCGMESVRLARLGKAS